MAFPLAIALAASLLQAPQRQIPRQAPLPAAPAAPAAAAPAPFALVNVERDPAGRMPLAAFGLGDGGIGGAGVGAAPAHPADVRSPGGIRVRAQPEGVKLDFPSGAEMLITPSLRLCLRSGEQTLPALGRASLLFADGSGLELEPDAGGRRPLRAASLVAGAQGTWFWPPARAGTLAVAAAAGRRRDGQIANPLLVLGDGRAVYRAVPLGPLLGLRAVLRPRDDPRFPAARFVLAGDVLAASLRRLPAHVPSDPIQFPQAPEAARRLADLAADLFAPGVIERSARARGPLVVALPQEWRLHVAVGAAHGTLIVGLHRADSSVPAVEWTVSRTRTELHIVRPHAGAQGSPRYFLRGLDLAPELRDVWPGRATADDLRWLHQELEQLGGRAASASVAVVER